MKPQATIKQHNQAQKNYFSISVEESQKIKLIEQRFASYEDCLTFISKHDWQLKREPSSSLHIPIQFMKP